LAVDTASEIALNCFGWSTVLIKIYSLTHHNTHFLTWSKNRTH